MSDEKLAAVSEELLRAYRVTFGAPDGQIVLRDLMKFCGFRAPINDEIGEGMRRVFLRCVNFTELDDEQILALYAGRHVKTGDKNV